MLQQVKISFLVLLCCTSLTWAEVVPQPQESICQQLIHFDRLQAATPANGTLHVIIRNPATNTSAYHQLPVNKETVDNVQGRLKVFQKQNPEKQVQTASDVWWLRWLSFWEKDHNKEQLFGHLALAMFNMSQPYVGSMAIVDGQHYCFSSSTSLEEGKVFDCGVTTGERVVGSMASVDYEKTATMSMLIFVETTFGGEKGMQIWKLKDNNLRPSTEMKRSRPNEKKDDTFTSSHDLYFGFIFAGTGHLWVNEDAGKPVVILFDDPRGTFNANEPVKVKVKKIVPANEYFQCLDSPASSPAFSSLPNPILSQKSIAFAATLGALLAAVAVVTICLLTKRKKRTARSRKKKGEEGEMSVSKKTANADSVRNQPKFKSKSGSSSSRTELSVSKLSTMSNTFQGGEHSRSRSLRQAGAIGSSTSSSVHSAISSTAAAEESSFPKSMFSAQKQRSAANRSANQG